MSDESMRHIVLASMETENEYVSEDAFESRYIGSRVFNLYCIFNVICVNLFLLLDHWLRYRPVTVLFLFRCESYKNL